MPRGGHFSPLPLSDGEFPMRRGKFIDIETFGLKATNIEAISGELVDLTILGNLTVGSGGVFRTAVSGNRVEISESDFDKVQFYDADALHQPGYITSGQSGSDRGVLLLRSPFKDADEYSELRIHSEDTTGDTALLEFVIGSAVGNGQFWNVGGTAGLPAFSFTDDPDTGMYLADTNSVGITAAGTLSMQWFSNVIYSDVMYSATSGNTQNVRVDSDGRLARSTSARKYKSRINYNMDKLADIVLQPAKFYRKDSGRWHLGFIADDLGDQDRMLGDYDGDEIESFDQNAVMAVMAAKINRLEKELLK